MRTRWAAGVVLLAAGLGASSEAWAQGSWCGQYIPGDTHPGKPECFTGPGMGTTGAAFIHKRVENICDDTIAMNQIAVDIVYPPPIPAGVRLTPIIFQHGGGAANSFCDRHTNDTSYPFSCDAPAGSPNNHYSNPYLRIADQLAHKGAVVMFPILNVGPGSNPWTDGEQMVRAMECLTRKTTIDGGCVDSDVACLDDLVGRVAWTASNKENLVVIGHSAGGLASMYLPRRLMSSLRGIIMIDPAKAEYMIMSPTAPLVTMASGAITAPVVHLYPDWYGPRQNSENRLFRLGAPNSCYDGRCDGGTAHGSVCPADRLCPGGGFCTNNIGCWSNADCAGGTCTNPAPVAGPYIPIGIKDLGVDPDSGTHNSHHCSPFNDSPSWMYAYDPEHYDYCNPAVTTCTNQKTAACPGGAASCGRDTFCRANQAPPGQTWQWGNAYYITHRYVVAYASCLGGRYGAYYQSWVNGRDRYLDDVGTNSSVCTYNGQIVIGHFCAGFFNRNDCEAHAASNMCHWAQGEDGSVIRINDGQRVTSYDPHTSRYYTAAEAYSATGTCEGGPTPGAACTGDAACGAGGNCTAGDFTERQELRTAYGGSERLVCTSAHVGF